MGIGLVILMHLVGIFILSVVLAIAGSIIVYFASGKEHRLRKVMLAIICPFIGLYTMYIIWFFGAIAISEYKDVDMGIGDAWYVPLSKNCRLLFIDVPEQVSIECGNKQLVAEVSKIQQVKDNIYGETYDGKYFAYDTINDTLSNFASKEELNKAAGRTELQDAIDFYYDQKHDIAGTLFTMLSIFALALGIGFCYLLCRISFLKWKPVAYDKADTLHH